MTGYLSSVNRICQVQSFEAFDQQIDHSPPPEKTWRIVAFDLDQCLFQPRPTLGDEHHNYFLLCCNQREGLLFDSHYSWLNIIRKEEISYASCEPAEKINGLIQKLKREGRTVIGLTSRLGKSRDVAEKHLKDAEIDLSIMDVVFREFLLEKKDQSFIRWIQEQDKFIDSEFVHIDFIDDSLGYCTNVASLADQVACISVASFQYLGALPRSDLSLAQIEQGVVQLYAHHRSQPIPYQHEKVDVENAVAGLGMNSLDPASFYHKSRQVALFKGYPF